MPMVSQCEFVKTGAVTALQIANDAKRADTESKNIVTTVTEEEYSILCRGSG